MTSVILNWWLRKINVNTISLWSEPALQELRQLRVWQSWGTMYRHFRFRTLQDGLTVLPPREGSMQQRTTQMMGTASGGSSTTPSREGITEPAKPTSTGRLRPQLLSCPRQ